LAPIKTLRVALICLGEISCDTGGQTYLREILGPLSSVADINLDAHLTDRRFVVPEGCKVYYYRKFGIGVLSRIITEAIVVRRVIQLDYDVLLAPLNYLPLVWSGPSVVVQHNLLAGKGASVSYGVLRAIYRRRAVASSVRRATYVIAVAHHLRNRLLEWYPDIDPSKVRVVPLAPATGLLATPPRDLVRPGKSGLSPKTVLVVGTLWAYKGVTEAVDAFALVARGCDDLRLVIAGPGSRSERRAIRRRAEQAGVHERVELLGNLTHAELGGWYRHAAVLLFLSRIESFPLPVVEAMAMGVPVVARRIAGVIEVAGNAPLWVDIEAESYQIAQTLEKALSDQDARAIAISRGLSRSAMLSWSNTADLTARALRDAVHKPLKP